MKFITSVIFIIIFIIALIFSILNFHPVQINLFFTHITLPLTVALTIELIAGIAIGVLAAVIYILKLKAEYAQLVKKIDKL